MDDKKTRRGSVELFLTREFFNSLVAVLDVYLQTGDANKYAVYAQRLKEKILRYGRCFTHQNEEQVVVYFYEDEAAILIKLFVIYVNATGTTGEDFFSLVGKK